MKKAFITILAVFVCQTAWAGEECPSYQNIQIALQPEGGHVVTVDLTLELTAFYEGIDRQLQDSDCTQSRLNEEACKAILKKQQAVEAQFGDLWITIHNDADLLKRKCNPLNVGNDQDGYPFYTLSCPFSDTNWTSLDIPAAIDDQNSFQTVLLNKECVNIANPPTSSNSEITDTSTPDTEPNTDPAVGYDETACGAGQTYNSGTGRCEATRAPHDSFSSDSSNVSASTQDEEIPPDASGNPSNGGGGKAKKGWFCSLNRSSGDASLSAIGLLFLVLLVARFRNKIA